MKTIPKHTLKFLDSFLEYRRPWVEVPGYTVAISKNGKIIFNNSYGLANVETKEKLTPQHIFRVASHSKTFTATSIFQLVEAKKLRIDDPVADYLTWLNKHSDKRWKDVTIRQLLSHGAGVIRDGKQTDYWQLFGPFPNKELLHKTVLDASLVLDPNTKMKYSNYGYSLLGDVIEAVSGQTYAEYVTKHIIKPLRLKNTYPDTLSGITMSAGYSRPSLEHTQKKLTSDKESTNAMASATGFCSTPEDLCVYFAAHMVGSGKLLSDESKKEMQRAQWDAEPNDGKYGLGFEIDKYGERTLKGHSGGFPGYRSRTMFDSEDGYVISIVANSDVGEPGVMARAITSIIDRFGEGEPKKSLATFEGRYADLSTTCEIIASGNGLMRIWPNWWDTFDEVEDLVYVNKTTLRIGKTGSYYAEGELIEFEFKKGKVDHIVSSGSTMYPSATGEIPPEIWKKLNSKY